MDALDNRTIVFVVCVGVVFIPHYTLLPGRYLPRLQ